MDDDGTYDIAVTRLAPGDDILDEAIVGVVSAALKAHHVARADVSVALVDDATIARLNEQHLGHEGPTDVITFDLSDDSEEGVEGEIVLSVDTARREAAGRGHSPAAEIALYVVHGTLHLLGYDDQLAADARDMHEREDAILSSLGIGPVYGRIAP
jgi:probable rRNA maturation factor